MGTIIRKISIGKDYPNGVMHYQVGKIINLAGISYEITNIVEDEELKLLGKVGYNVYISNDDGVVLWKSIVDLPVVIENDVNFS